jgi:hypothetical protein
MVTIESREELKEMQQSMLLEEHLNMKNTSINLEAEFYMSINNWLYPSSPL